MSDGLDAAAIGTWMAPLVDASPPLRLAPIGQGKSNITVLVEDAARRRWVLRRPPLGKLLPSAHDVAREYRILAALQGTAVPAPGVIALCTDPAVTDSPLLLMEHVDGLVIDSGAAAGALSEPQRGRVAYALVPALASIHAVDLGAAGLTDLASHSPYAARQLKRWTRQWRETRTRPLPRVDELAERLAGAVPEQRELTLVHGDFHLRNVICAPSGDHIRAVLDWELSTLGDPLADLGGLLAYWPEPGDPPGALFSAFALPGFPTRDELAGAYALATGRDLAALGFWHVLGLWKVVVILEGVRRRALDDARNAARGAIVEEAAIDAVLERAWATAARVGL